MVPSPRAKKRTRKQACLLVLTLILLAVAGVGLYRCPLSLQDISRLMQSAVSKIAGDSAGNGSAESSVRGTVYDTTLNELAVSYRLHRLYVHPAEIREKTAVAGKLALVIGEKPEIVLAQLKSSQHVVELAGELDAGQVGKINSLNFHGVYTKASSVRFYPNHTGASHLIGFMGDGVGLAGVEGRYDAVLQPGAFRQENIAEIDFKGQETLGKTSTDLILTLDLGVQKKLEGQFRKYLAEQSATKGMGLVLDISNGRILALTNQPSFNPNYFWQADDSSRVNKVYRHYLDKDLVRKIFVRAAAIQRNGLVRGGVLPETVAAPDWGLENEEIEEFENQLKLFAPVADNWKIGQPGNDFQSSDVRHAGPVTGVQVGVALASLVNGGWRITPYVVDSIYDHSTAIRYPRKGDATEKSHVLDPAIGVKVRRQLFAAVKARKKKNQKKEILYSSENYRVINAAGFSRYSMQQICVGLAPADKPKYLLLMAVEKDHLYPLNKKSLQGVARLHQTGQTLLTALASQPDQAPPEIPRIKSQENQEQFFISKRMNFKELPPETPVITRAMPEVKGLSLRKGLQLLNSHGVVVKVQGSGRIIKQVPRPGEPLSGVNECTLTLESEI